MLSDVISFTELAAKVLPAYMGQMREALKTPIPMADFCRPVSRRPPIKLKPGESVTMIVGPPGSQRYDSNGIRLEIRNIPVEATANAK